MHTLEVLIGISLTMSDANLHYSTEPIAYCTFPNRIKNDPVADPNTVFIPVIDPFFGPMLQVKAVRALAVGEMVNLKHSKVISEDGIKKLILLFHLGVLC